MRPTLIYRSLQHCEKISQTQSQDPYEGTGTWPDRAGDAYALYIEMIYDDNKEQNKYDYIPAYHIIMIYDDILCNKISSMASQIPVEINCILFYVIKHQSSLLYNCIEQLTKTNAIISDTSSVKK